MLWQAKLLWNCSAKMRHARMEKINVVYSNNGWNVRIVAKYNFLIPVRAPSLPAQPATSPSLTKSPSPSPRVSLSTWTRHHHIITIAHCRLQISLCGQGGAVQCWLVCAALLRPADWRGQAAAARTSCAQLRRPPAPARTAAAACRVSADPADQGPRNTISISVL